MIAIIIFLTILFSFLAFSIQFTEVKTGTMKYITKGGQYVRTLKESIDSSSNLDTLCRVFGYRFVGWKFLNYGLKIFPINTDKEKTGADGSDPKDWLIRGETKESDEIREHITRFLVVHGAELGGTSPMQVDLGISMVFEVIDEPGNRGRFVFYYNANWTNPLGLVHAAVNVEIEKFEKYKELLENQKNFLDELTSVSSQKCQKLQKDLEMYGLRLISIKVPYIATDKTIEEAARKKDVAQLELDAKKIDYEAITAKAEKDAEAIKMIETAKLKTIVDQLKIAFPSISEEEMVARVTDIIGKRAFADMPNLTTLVTDLIRK